MTQLIPLTQGRYTLVDAEQFVRLNIFKWRFQPKNPGDLNGYAVREDKRKKIYMHRLIINCPPGLVTDHIDGNGLNNTLANLRRACYQQNSMNKYNPRGTSKYKGVHKIKGSNRWRSQIRINKNVIEIGCFKYEIEAAKAYDKKAFELFCEFARLNFPEDYKLPSEAIPF